MAYGGKRGGAGERVLEGRHVIGLFCLMLLFSGVFFTLGYVMGKNQFDTQVRAADPSLAANPAILPKKDPGGKRGAEPGNLKAGPDATPMYPEWEFYHAGNVKKADDHLKGTESVEGNREGCEWPCAGKSSSHEWQTLAECAGNSRRRIPAAGCRAEEKIGRARARREPSEEKVPRICHHAQW